MKKIVSKVLAIVFAIIISFSFGSCNKKADVNDIDSLNKVAMNTLLGYADDYPSILVLEEDQYGRRLFLFEGVTKTAGDNWDYGALVTRALIVSQKTEGGYVYYYPDYCFIAWRYERVVAQNEDEMRSEVYETVPGAEIERLKGLNDWGRPIDDSRCVKAEVTRRRRSDYEELVPRAYLVRALHTKDPYARYGGIQWLYYLTSDEYDRHIYFFRTMDQDNNYTASYVVMFMPDGTFDSDAGIMEVTDLYNYQDELKGFKDRNGWGTPIEGR